MKQFSFSPIARFLTFRKELGLLWRAFRAAETPTHLKVLMILVPLYLLSPLDLIPDVVPVLGWLDDIVIVPMLASWIVGMLPQMRPAPARAPSRQSDRVIETSYRRL